jgi:hypothetical protein
MDTGTNSFLTPVNIEPVSTPPVGVQPPTPPRQSARTDLFSNPAYRFTPPVGRQAEEIRTSPQDMEIIRNYMLTRKGAHVNNYSDEELYDTFINHMRSFNVNEVTTGGELLWVRRASEEDRQLANQAYGIFDSLGSVFTNDGISGACCLLDCS